MGLFLSLVHVTKAGGSAAVSHSEQSRGSCAGGLSPPVPACPQPSPPVCVSGGLLGARPGATVRGETPWVTLTRPRHSLRLLTSCCHVP